MISLTVNGAPPRGRRRPGHAAALRAARHAAVERRQIRLRPRPVRRLHRHGGRSRRVLLPDCPPPCWPGGQVRTVEGLGTVGSGPARLQQAFIDEQAAQCGYCIAGMVMRAQALLERNGTPTEAQIRAHMQPNLCRCGTHMRIMAAIKRAAATMKPAGHTRPRAGGCPMSAPMNAPVERRAVRGGLVTSGVGRADGQHSRSARRSRRSRCATRPNRRSSCPAASPRTPQLSGMGAGRSPDGAVTVFTGKAELGQGIRTALICRSPPSSSTCRRGRSRWSRPDTARTPERGLHRRQPFHAGQRHRHHERRRRGARRSWSRRRRSGSGCRRR